MRITALVQNQENNCTQKFQLIHTYIAKNKKSRIKKAQKCRKLSCMNWCIFFIRATDYRMHLCNKILTDNIHVFEYKNYEINEFVYINAYIYSNQQIWVHSSPKHQLFSAALYQKDFLELKQVKNWEDIVQYLIH